MALHDTEHFTLKSMNHEVRIMHKLSMMLQDVVLSQREGKIIEMQRSEHREEAAPVRMMMNKR